MTTIPQPPIEASTSAQAAANVAQGLMQQAGSGRFDRIVRLLGAASGILSAALILFGFMGLVLGSGFLPDTTAPLPEIAAHLAQYPATARVWAGAQLEFVGFLLLVVFITYLCGVLRRAEGEQGWLSTLAFAAGLMCVFLKVASFAPVYPLLIHTSQPIDPLLARTLFEMNDAAYDQHMVTLGLMLLPTAIVVIRTAVLPRWLGALAGLAAVLLLASVVVPALAQPAVPVFIVWQVGSSITLMRRVGMLQRQAFSAPASGG